MDVLAARCEEQRGARYDDAQAALQGGYPLGPVCSPALTPLAEGDTCGAATAGDEVCQLFYQWFSTDPGECAGGACACELRFRRNDLDAHGGQAVICAARFEPGGVTP